MPNSSSCTCLSLCYVMLSAMFHVLLSVWTPHRCDDPYWPSLFASLSSMLTSFPFRTVLHSRWCLNRYWLLWLDFIFSYTFFLLTLTLSFNFSIHIGLLTWFAKLSHLLLNTRFALRMFYKIQYKYVNYCFLKWYTQRFTKLSFIHCREILWRCRSGELKITVDFICYLISIHFSSKDNLTVLFLTI